MKLPANVLITTLLVCSFGIPGCRKPGPIELQDSSPSEIIDVQSISSASYLPNEADTTGLVARDRTLYFGELIVAGVRYDGPSVSHTVSVARAMFRNKSDSVVYNGRFLGYRTLFIGSVYIDGLPLYSVLTRIRLGVGTTDTVVGVHYLLVNTDGVGGRGFTFTPSHIYQWRNSPGSGVVLNVDARSPKEIRVLRPTPLDHIQQREGLPVEWTGGEDTLLLIISVPEAGRPPNPIMRLRIRSDSKRVTIPWKIIQLLPTDRSANFIFTFISLTRSAVQVSGFPDMILVHSASVHNILLAVQQ